MDTASNNFTPRETAIGALLVHGGLTNTQIGGALGMAEKTVKVHLHNMFLKLGAKNRTQVALLLAKRTQ